MKILVIDVGGTHVKVRATGRNDEIKIPSGSDMTARKMASAVNKNITGWKYDVISIGYPGAVVHGLLMIDLAGCLPVILKSNVTRSI